MASSSPLTNGARASLRQLFRRCVQCPDDNPACPPCAADEKCSLQFKTCDTCPFTTCVKATTDNSAQASQSSGPSSAVGPLVGGVVGGLAVILLAVFLVWWFCIRRRKRRDEAAWQASVGLSGGFGREKYGSRRGSTHTVASIASTVYTRASNVIQIAYIPGITNRSHSTPDLVPPVPPIPAMSPAASGASSPFSAQGHEQHFFMPSDLRHSGYSNFSDRSSTVPNNPVRGSVASTLYRSNAVVNPVPAQAAQRVKATPVISVRSSTKGSPDLSRSGSPAPPMPAMPSRTLSSQSSQPSLNTKSSIVGRIGTARPVTVARKGSSGTPRNLSGPNSIAQAGRFADYQAGRSHELPGSSPGTAPSSAGLSPFTGTERRQPAAAFSVSSDDMSDLHPPPRIGANVFDDPTTPSTDMASDDEEAAARRSLIAAKPPGRQSRATASDADQSPLVSPLPSSYTHSPRLQSEDGLLDTDDESRRDRTSMRRAQQHQRRSSNNSINQIIADAARRATQQPRHGGLGYRPAAPHDSPFSDAHAAETP